MRQLVALELSPPSGQDRGVNHQYATKTWMKKVKQVKQVKQMKQMKQVKLAA